MGKRGLGCGCCYGGVLVNQVLVNLFEGKEECFSEVELRSVQSRRGCECAEVVVPVGEVS